MGWTFTRGASKADIIREVTTRRPFEYQGKTITDRVLDRSLAGNALWVLFERTIDAPGQPRQVEVFITLFLLSRSRESGGWGYTDMDAASHPYTYSAPLRFLERAPVENEEWRAGVHAYWRDREKTANLRATLKVGDKVRLKNGFKPASVTIIEVGKTFVGLSEEGRRYRVKPDQMDEVID